MLVAMLTWKVTTSIIRRIFFKWVVDTVVFDHMIEDQMHLLDKEFLENIGKMQLPVGESSKVSSFRKISSRRRRYFNKSFV